MRHLALILLVAMGLCREAMADAYPEKRITVIVPFGAGSGTDSVARIVTQRLAETLKATIVVENRPGANGAIGAAAAARSAPDGYTLFFGGSSTQAANPNMLKSIQYDPKQDFAPIARLGLFPYVLVINPTISARNVGELVALAREKPFSFAYANALGQLSGEILKRRASIAIEAIPYKSSPEAITDVVAGRVAMIFSDLVPAMPLIQSGQLRALATITQGRSALLPELRSIPEQGYDFPNITAWTGMFAPRNTPPEIIARLSDLLRDVLAEPTIRQKLAEIGFEAQWLGPKDFTEKVNADIALWATLVKEAGIERQ
jgi:tripartite-type tricarboxylate transporter receptor subunit TctC